MAAKDFGSIRETAGQVRAQAVVIRLAVALSVIVVAALLWLPFQAQRTAGRAAARAEAREWAISGPPCPAIAPAWWRSLAIEKPQAFAFEEIAGVRAHGDVTCIEIDRDAAKPFPICRLSAPFALRLDTSRGPLYFEPGVGQPVTISMAGGRLGCVLGVGGGRT